MTHQAILLFLRALVIGVLLNIGIHYASMVGAEQTATQPNQAHAAPAAVGSETSSHVLSMER